MKRFKKLAAVTLSSLLLVCSMGFTRPVNGKELDFQREMEAQQGALDAYEQLWNRFEKDSESLQPIYPDTYGGEYIEGDKLVLQLTQNTPENQAMYLEWCGNSDKVVFKEVPYSLNYLEGLKAQAELLSKDYAVTGYGVARKENNFEIRVKPEDLNAVEQSMQRRRSTAPIVFAASEELQDMATPLWGGDGVRFQRGGGASIAIGGAYQGGRAVLSCGHGGATMTGLTTDETVSFDGVQFGKVKYVRYDYNGYGDFSISSVDNSNFVTTKKVWNEATLSVTMSSLYQPIVPVGTMVYKNGATTNDSSGSVFATNQTETTTNGMTIQGLTKAWVYVPDYIPEKPETAAIGPGDSGGSVYFKSGGLNHLVGVVKGGVKDSGSSHLWQMVFTPIIYPIQAGFTMTQLN